MQVEYQCITRPCNQWNAATNPMNIASGFTGQGLFHSFNLHWYGLATAVQSDAADAFGLLQSMLL